MAHKLFVFIIFMFLSFAGNAASTTKTCNNLLKKMGRDIGYDKFSNGQFNGKIHPNLKLKILNETLEDLGLYPKEALIVQDYIKKLKNIIRLKKVNDLLGSIEKKLDLIIYSKGSGKRGELELVDSSQVSRSLIKTYHDKEFILVKNHEVFVSVANQNVKDLKNIDIIFDEILNLISYLPNKFIKKLTTISIVKYPKEIAEEERVILGRYFSKIIELYFEDHRRESLTQPHVIRHEFGHLIDHYMFRSGEVDKSYKRAIEADGNLISSYGEKNVSEDFAEAFSLYVEVMSSHKKDLLDNDYHSYLWSINDSLGFSHRLTNEEVRELYKNRFKYLDDIFSWKRHWIRLKNIFFGLIHHLTNK